MKAVPSSLIRAPRSGAESELKDEPKIDPAHDRDATTGAFEE